MRILIVILSFGICNDLFAYFSFRGAKQLSVLSGFGLVGLQIHGLI
jgi:hypothetical protein